MYLQCRRFASPHGLQTDLDDAKSYYQLDIKMKISVKEE